jgi:NADPH:quinone reductase-like Zn-dependent oxidoreductase
VQEALLVREVRFDGSVDHRLASAGQPDTRASTVCGVGSPLDETCVGQAVETFRHAPGGEKCRLHQLGGVELVRRPGATQRREQVEPARLQSVAGELPRELRVGKLTCSEEAAEEAKGGHVQVGALAPPLREDLVEVVDGLLRHRVEYFHERSLSSKYLPDKIRRPVARLEPTDTAIPPRMSAIRLHAPGLAGLVFEEIETPRLRTGEALVQVHAAAITRDELDWPVDRLPAIPSYELSGVVAAVAPDVEDVAVGEAVFALTAFDRDGVAATYAAVPASLLAPKPSAIEHVESAALPLAALSAWQGLFDHGRLAEGERVLIHGAAGGVGHVATQLARWRGAYVIGTTSPDNLDAARAYGADEVLDGRKERFEETVAPVDLVFDTVGAELLERSPAVVRTGGRLVSVAEEQPQIEASYFVVEPNREQLDEIARLVDGGALRPAIDSVFSLSEARAAFERSLASGKQGKVVIRVADD